MSKFKAFMNRGRDQEVELKLEAFEEPIKLKPVKQNQANKIQQQVVKFDPKKGTRGADFDPSRLQTLMAIESMVYPDLTDAELQDSYGALDAEALYGAMFLAGEGQEITQKVMEISGYNTSFEEMTDEAKN